jgi:hypothetical protein
MILLMADHEREPALKNTAVKYCWFVVLLWTKTMPWFSPAVVVEDPFNSSMRSTQRKQVQGRTWWGGERKLDFVLIAEQVLRDCPLLGRMHETRERHEPTSLYWALISGVFVHVMEQIMRCTP